MAADETNVQISEGYVDWGIKESWRNYIKGGDLSGGAEQLPDGNYRWPITSGSFDTESKLLQLKLGGSINYKGYCADDGNCQLDSTFENLSVEIGPDRQVLLGTYVGKPRTNPEAGPEQVTGVLATLDISQATAGTENGTANWSGITSTAGDALLLYASGTPTDPVTIQYKGPAGLPDISERWDTPGAPAYDQSSSWNAESTLPPAYYLTEARDTLITIETFEGPTSKDRSQRLSALDAKTLKLLGSTNVNVGSHSYLRTAFDPRTGTVFYKSSASAEGRATVSLNAATWNSGTQQFEVEQDIDAISRDGVDVSAIHAGGVMVWVPATAELVWTSYVDAPGSNPMSDQKVRVVARGETSRWSAQETSISVPPEMGSQPKHAQSGFFGATGTGVHNPHEALALNDGSIVFTSSGELQGADGTSEPMPLVHVSRQSDGTWQSVLVPGAFGPDTVGYGAYSYTSVVAAADGSMLAGGNAWSGALGYYTQSADGSFEAEHVDPSPGDKTLKVLGVGSDAALGFDFSVDSIQETVNVLKERKPLSSFPLKNTDYHSRIVATPDHSLLVLTSPANAPHTIQRLSLLGTTPVVALQPSASSVSLVQGALSGSASLGVEWSATGDTTVQWQRKLPTQKRFTDVPGATTAQFAPEVELEHDGAEFRAVLSNAAGKVVSDTAKVTVASAPRFLAQPTDLTIRDGDTARLTAPIAPGITGAQRWEHLTGDTWTPIETGGPFTVAGDTLTIIANPDLDGAQFRSVLANDVGENTSDAAALTVLAKTVIPAEGQKYEGVTFEWDVSNEVQAKPPFGGANHLSAGVSDGSEASYQAEAGNVRITHTTADGTRTPASYATRAAFVGTGGKQLLTLTGGTATVKPDGSAVVTWQGAFSINMYGGLVPFTITNPTLTVTPDGTGTLTGDMSGYAGDMQNPTVKTPIDPVTGVTIATFTGAKLDTLNPFTVTPEYAGVRVNLPAEATPQLQTGEHWGSWPQGFVDFQVKTGLSSYWYSSGSSFDPKKAPNPITIDFTTAEVVTPPITPEPETQAPAVTQHPTAVSVEAGKQATFTAQASGTPAPTVQWQRQIAGGEWVNVEGATSPEYVIAKAELAANGAQFRAVFTNSEGTAETNAAALTVTERLVKPEPTGPGTTDPGATGPGTTGPGATGPGKTDPGGKSPSPAPDSKAPGAQDGDKKLAKTGAADTLGLSAAAALLLLAGAAAMTARAKNRRELTDS
ncbi:HtaA domain-containing protein [Leucobacter luti]|uniref:HtaA domain-containing protein n=1 Tax=Leucobacter luti TaxID=340320 RepID=UPI003CFEDC2F